MLQLFVVCNLDEDCEKHMVNFVCSLFTDDSVFQTMKHQMTRWRHKMNCKRCGRKHNRSVSMQIYVTLLWIFGFIA
jgi:hypothetical protein